MRSRDLLAALVLLGFVGCGTTGRATDHQRDTHQILQVLQAARSALLNDRPHAVCDLPTAHGRKRSLGFQVDFAAEGTPVPSTDPRLPQTCEQVVARMWSQVRHSHGAITWPADLRRVTFAVPSINGTRATAE